jgi:hypothetical protein
VGDYPNAKGLPLTIYTMSRYATPFLCRSILGGSAAPGSTAWATANLAIHTPVVIPFRYPVRNLFWHNGSTAAGNVEMAIFNSEYTRVVTSGAVLQAGTTVVQFAAVDQILDPGQYYFTLALSGTTGTIMCMGGGTATRDRYLGLTQTAAGSLPLAASVTPATIANARVPLCGVTWMSGTPAF